jgi:hypothetical protein
VNRIPDFNKLLRLAQDRLDSSRSGKYWPRMAVVEYGGIKYKVRFYPDIDWASRQEALIQLAQERIKMPAFLGREGECLVFRVESLQPAETRDIHELYRAMGQVLGSLASTRSIPAREMNPDSEFSRWLEDLRQLGFVSPKAQAALQLRYEDLKPIGQPQVIDYWDAMPHNFGWRENSLYLLDEKHLHYSFQGVGLIKPSLLVDRSIFEDFLEGYSRESDPVLYRAQHSFLLLYYLVASLHFYSLQYRDGVQRIASNPRLRYYRSGLIRSIWSSPAERLQEAARFTIRYPLDAILALKNRLSGPVSLVKIRDRVRLELLPWDHDEF